MSFRILLEKESFKFSGSHFTIFGAGHSERLHGHNYYVAVEISVHTLDAKLGLAFDFNLIKPLIREIAAELDERVLIPMKSPFLQVTKLRDSIELNFSQKKYVLPESDVKCLDLSNITSEELARYFAMELEKKVTGIPEIISRISGFSVGIEETRGQTVFFDLTTRKNSAS